MKPKVSIIIPYVRPERVGNCIKLAINNAGIPSDEFEIIARKDVNNIGCPKMVANLVSVSLGQCVAFIGDDCAPCKDWLKNALIAMDTLPQSWGLVGLNDRTNRFLACHWLADKRLLRHLDGEFFHTGYKHCYCDNELTDRCSDLGRFTYCLDAVVEHKHPLLATGEVFDKFYQRAYAKENVEHDKNLYSVRKTNNWEGS